MEDPTANPRICARLSASIELLQDVSIDSNTTILDGDTPTISVHTELMQYFQNAHASTPSYQGFWGALRYYLGWKDIIQQHNQTRATILISCSRFIGLKDTQSVVRQFYSKLPQNGLMIIGTLGILDHHHPILQTLKELSQAPHWNKIAQDYCDILAYKNQDPTAFHKITNWILWKNMSIEYKMIENQYKSESEFSDWIHDWLGSIEAVKLSPDFDNRAFSKEFASCYVQKTGFTCNFIQIIIQAQKR